MNIATLVLAVSFLPYFEDRNQVANFVLSPPAAGQEVRPEKPKLKIDDKSSVCSGTGELSLEEPDYGQLSGRIGGAKKTKKKCPVCSGRGKVESYMAPADLTRKVAEDRSAFEANHQSKGEIPVGQAFVPNATYKAADKATLKLVDEAYCRPCPKCTWTGIEACSKCHGKGLVACPEKDCKAGFLVTKTTIEKSRTSSGGASGRSFGNNRMRSSSRRTSSRETKVTVQVCPTCGGAKMVACPECGGMKAHPCKKCNGLGTKQKAGGL